MIRDSLLIARFSYLDDEVEQQANTIINGEKAANPNFAGFVYQGNAYEGLTCDALEWLASSGGGTGHPEARLDGGLAKLA